MCDIGVSAYVFVVYKNFFFLASGECRSHEGQMVMLLVFKFGKLIRCIRFFFHISWTFVFIKLLHVFHSRTKSIHLSPFIVTRFCILVVQKANLQEFGVVVVWSKWRIFGIFCEKKNKIASYISVPLWTESIGKSGICLLVLLQLPVVFYCQLLRRRLPFSRWHSWMIL